jgi:hypothetical protein
MRKTLLYTVGWFSKARAKWAQKRLQRFRLSNHFSYAQTSSSVEMWRGGSKIEGSEFALFIPIDFEAAFWLARKIWLQDLIRSRGKNLRPHVLFTFQVK